MDQKNLHMLGEAIKKTGLGEAIKKTGQIRSIILICMYGLLCCFPREVFQTQSKIHDGAILQNSQQLCSNNVSIKKHLVFRYFLRV